MRRFAILLAAAISLFALTASAAVADSQVRYSKSCADAGYKPSRIAITCADAKVLFEADDWSRWDSTGATATGELSYPDCPASVPLYRCSNYAHDDATVKLYRVRPCPQRHHRYFTRLLLLDPEASDPHLRRLVLKDSCSYVR
jgi:hypothetical protein